MLIWMSCLCKQNINPLSIISFANILSHSVGCLFILSVVPFAVQNLSSLIRPYLFSFVFISFTLRDGSKNKQTKNIAAIYIQGWSAYDFLEELYSMKPYI